MSRIRHWQPGVEVVAKAATPGSRWQTNLITKKNGQVVSDVLLHNSTYTGKAATIKRNTSGTVAATETQSTESAAAPSEAAGESTAAAPAETTAAETTAAATTAAPTTAAPSAGSTTTVRGMRTETHGSACGDEPGSVRYGADRSERTVAEVPPESGEWSDQ